MKKLRNADTMLKSARALAATVQAPELIADRLRDWLGKPDVETLYSEPGRSWGNA